MKLQRIPTCFSLLACSLVTLSGAPAQAFSFTTNFEGSSPKGDIFLKSVTLTDGTVVNNFSLVNAAKIVSNDLWTGGNSGAASADMGDNATVGISKENPTDSDIATALGNLNLNSIIDTEDSGKSIINVFFERAVDTLFFWERGQNSHMDVQAIDKNGNLVGNLLNLYSSNWNYAGYSIDTKEISGAQKVGSLGITLADLGLSDSIAGLQITSKKTYNGPDWKVVGSASASASVPEPATLAGLGVVAGLIATSRRKVMKQA
ncbi:PEP-CTERM sorting domain-containing protein [Oculatella sp. LEGE 06141]|uniref:exosortase-dependent surface protein XDP2 n=1 Tax=Oculatella sp. LEGE 06141 TaxID=1828648 RepID=UPI001882CDB1|nr:exosortase-dependent surface protein XDP2 [Oculatella sp. LEGE 06141]MBE9177000.1 PEP-CTERM sorting domain-containing protein [Oculatella sp. LEGE 06141]